MILLQLGRLKEYVKRGRGERMIRYSTAWSGSGAGLGGRKGKGATGKGRSEVTLNTWSVGREREKMRKSTAWRHGVKRAQSVKTLVKAVMEARR